MEFIHVPVLAAESIEALSIKADGIYVDGTAGGGNHSAMICARLNEGRLVCIDRDIEAVKAAGARLREYEGKFTIVQDNYKNIKEILSSLHIDSIDGALLDLGVSSHQLDEPERGFSYRFDSVLDMRMDRSAALSAEVIVNTYSERALVDMIFRYGEDKNARRIAKRIVENRPIKTTLQLVEIIKSAFTAKERFEGKHPAKRTFQAIRIECNSELEGLDTAIRDFAECLKPGGRLAIITFHSLEQTIVKKTFSDLALGCTCPKDFPVCVCGGVQKYKVITKKGIDPSADELERNPRSASARLRVLERI